jgi:predicted dehydrogenase
MIQPTQPVQRFSFALVGCGEIALSSARAIAASGVGRLVACVDPNRALAEDLSRRHGGRPHTALEEALSSEQIDGVIIATPHHFHRDLAIAALEAGKHVIVEKPLARNTTEAAQIIQVATQRALRLSVFFPLRYSPEMIWARDFIAGGALGRILGIRLVEHLYKEMPYWTGGASGRSRVAWRGVKEKSGGGVLLMNIIHQLDLMRHLTGLEVEKVYCEYDTLDTPIDVEDVVAMSLRFDGRAIGIIDASTCMVGDGPSDLRLWGSDGQVVLTAPFRYLTLQARPGRATGEWCRLPRLQKTNPRAAFLREFVQAVWEERSTPCPGEDGLAVQAIIDAAYESMSAGRTIAPRDVLAAAQAR